MELIELTPDDASMLALGGQAASNPLLEAEQVDVMLQRCSNADVRDAGCVLFGRKGSNEVTPRAQLLADGARKWATRHGARVTP